MLANRVGSKEWSAETRGLLFATKQATRLGNLRSGCTVLYSRNVAYTEKQDLRCTKWMDHLEDERLVQRKKSNAYVYRHQRVADRRHPATHPYTKLAKSRGEREFQCAR